MDVGAIIAVLVFFALLCSIYAAIYFSARRSVLKGEMKAGGLAMLRWAFVGSAVLFILLGLTAFLI